MYETLDLKIEERVAWLTLNRPDKLNALTPTTMRELRHFFTEVDDNEDVCVVVLRGAGERAFCAGGDLAGNLAPDQGRVASHELRGRVADLIQAIAGHPQPVIARVNGVALAGGLGLMLACDLVVAANDVQFGTPEINLGLWPYMISAVIQRNLPRKPALDMMLTGRRVSAEEGERWGMVNRVVARELLDQTVQELVTELASKSPLILSLGKRSFYQAQDMPLEDALAYLQAMLTVNLESEDVAEGVSAFLQKRTPEWKGR
jgi:enoyl-CoA hydratase/carnithine racemase